jgi:hypothetical protein
MWDQTSNSSNLVSRAEAIKQTFAKAKELGYKDTFKVRYDGHDVVTPNDLPEQVDMTLVTIASVLNQA